MTCGCAYCSGGSWASDAGGATGDRGAAAITGKPEYDSGAAALQLTRRVTIDFTPATPTPIVMSYAYRATDAAPAAPSGQRSWVGGLEPNMGGFTAFNAAQIDAMEAGLNLIEDVANITLTRVGSGNSSPAAYSDNAQILIGNFTTGAATIFYEGLAVRRSFVTDSGVHVRAAKLWFDGSQPYVTAPTNQNGAPRLYIHEALHALGLSHPGDYDAAVPGYSYANSSVYQQDSGQYTLMSYFDEAETGGNFGANTGMTPLLHDVAALQRLYGANMKTRVGDTIYGFNSNTGYEAYTLLTNTSRRVFTIWDAGGEDTIDLSQYLTSSRINLAEESFSSAGTRADGGGMVNNISIARGAVVENAIGGAGDDALMGNGANNKLFGGAGKDQLLGKAGDDLIDGGPGVDSAVFTAAYVTATIQQGNGFVTVTTPNEGVDKLFDVERLIFNDRTVAIDVAPGQNAGAAFRLYQAAFARQPDQTGLTFWADCLGDGRLDLRGAAEGFVGSVEFASIYGANPSKAQIIDKFYRNVLGREGEATGVAFWIGRLEAGGSTAEVLVGFSESPENYALTAPLIGQGVFVDSLAALIA